MKLLLDAIFPPRESELVVRACTTDDLVALLSPTVIRVPGSEISEVTSLLPYQHPLVQACVLEAKFHGNARATALLGHALCEYLTDFIIKSLEFPQENIIFVPIPLSRARLRSRGYNQTERIAREAFNSARDEFEGRVCLEPNLLRRTRDTQPQTSLGGAARRQNMIEAFILSPSVQTDQSYQAFNPAHTYILFDDVVTTGATLSSAVQTLKNAGAHRVFALALAH
ncbi:hypothetical protein BH11PAT2_BH11PAT2_02390 [soil metagenome]